MRSSQSFYVIILLAACQVSLAALSFSSGYTFRYDCTGDPVACQQMCYHMYCMGRSNCITKHEDKDRKVGGKLNRKMSGMRGRPFNSRGINKYGTSVVDTINTVPDEWPPASAIDGGKGAILMGHGLAYRIQGGMISTFWKKAREEKQTRQVCIEPFNWDPDLSPACNCKPNIPEHVHTNTYGDRCNCDDDIMHKHQYTMTKSKDEGGPEYKNIFPDSYWKVSPWNYQGYHNPPKKPRAYLEIPAEAPKINDRSSHASTPISPVAVV